MVLHKSKRRLGRVILLSLPLALLGLLFFPTVASAHAILIRSDPTADARLTAAPTQVRMWFTEALNPVFSTAEVINAANKQVDRQDVHVNATDSTEMDVSLQSNLPPDVYIVVYRTDSAIDGHILRGSFLFTVLNPDGTAPTLSPGANPGVGVLGGGGLTGTYTGLMDGPTFFNLVMVTLVELGAVFWVGAQLWLNFVLQSSAEVHAEERETNAQVERRFERWFSLPALLVVLLANVGVLIGQAIILTGGDWGQALAPGLLGTLATSGRFGAFWLMREGVLLLAGLIALYMLLVPQRPKPVKTILPLANLLLGTALFIAITMSSHAAAVTSALVPYAIIVDWLHLLAAAAWIGGMFYIAAVYLPVLKKSRLQDRTRSLLALLPYFTPLALAGVLIMSITGPFSATFHLTSWQQFINTAYGRVLLVKIALVGGLLLTSAIHVGLLRPRLKKEYKKYNYAVARLAAVELAGKQSIGANLAGATLAKQATFTKAVESGSGDAGKAGGSDDELKGDSIDYADRASRLLAQQVRVREKRLASKTRRLTSILRWEPLLGVAVIVCVGLLNAFGGTLNPPPGTAALQQTGNTTGIFSKTLPTKDGLFDVTIVVNPNRFGTNLFTVSVADKATGKAVTNVGVVLYTTMLDMDMGTQSVNLLPDGKGHFSSQGDLAMAGNWQLRIQVRTTDNTLHEAIVDIVTPF